jgi:hypothetical protein
MRTFSLKPRSRDAPGYPRRRLRRAIAAASISLAATACGCAAAPVAASRAAAPVAAIVERELEPAPRNADGARAETGRGDEIAVPVPDVPPLGGGLEPEAARISRGDAPTSHFEGSVAQRAPRLAGSLSSAALREQLRAAAPALRSCYARALTERPEFSGPTSVRFVIAPSGRVQDAAAIFEPDAPDLERCVEAALEALTFPPVPGGGSVIVTFPFALEPETS